MTMLSGTGQVYHQSGASGVGRQNREDLMDMITNVTPAETPFLSNLKRSKATNVYHEWLTHSLANAATTTALEGDVASFTSPTTLTRNVNICQINAKTIAVSGTQEVVMKAGMKSEMAYRVVNATKEMKRDLELSMFQNTAANTGGATTARVLKGVAGFCTTSSTTTAVTRTDIQTMLQTLFTAGCSPDVMYVNAAMKTKVSALAGLSSSAYQWNMDADAKRFSYAVNIWDGDFGVQRVVAAHQMGTQSIAALELQHWRHAVLRPLQTTDLAKDGDNEKKMILMESTLEALATASSGAYYTWTG
jgi:hypothetical protein